MRDDIGGGLGGLTERFVADSWNKSAKREGDTYWRKEHGSEASRDGCDDVEGRIPRVWSTHAKLL